MSIRDKKASTRKLGDRRSPIENVELFTYSVGLSQENNFMDNAEKLAKYVWANIGNIGNVIDKKEYPVIARKGYSADRRYERSRNPGFANYYQHLVDKGFGQARGAKA